MFFIRGIRIRLGICACVCGLPRVTTTQTSLEQHRRTISSHPLFLSRCPGGKKEIPLLASGKGPPMQIGGGDGGGPSSSARRERKLRDADEVGSNQSSRDKLFLIFFCSRICPILYVLYIGPCRHRPHRLHRAGLFVLPRMRGDIRDEALSLLHIRTHIAFTTREHTKICEKMSQKNNIFSSHRAARRTRSCAWSPRRPPTLPTAHSTASPPQTAPPTAPPAGPPSPPAPLRTLGPPPTTRPRGRGHRSRS